MWYLLSIDALCDHHHSEKHLQSKSSLGHARHSADRVRVRVEFFVLYSALEDAVVEAGIGGTSGMVQVGRSLEAHRVSITRA